MIFKKEKERERKIKTITRQAELPALGSNILVECARLTTESQLQLARWKRRRHKRKKRDQRSLQKGHI